LTKLYYLHGENDSVHFAQATLQQIATQQGELTQQVDSTICDLEKERHLLTEQQKKVTTNGFLYIVASNAM